MIRSNALPYLWQVYANVASAGAEPLIRAADDMYIFACSGLRTACRDSRVDPSPIAAKATCFCLRIDLTNPLTVIRAWSGSIDGPISAFSKALIAMREGRVTKEDDRVNMKRDIDDETRCRATLEKAFGMWLAMGRCGFAADWQVESKGSREEIQKLELGAGSQPQGVK